MKLLVCLAAVGAFAACGCGDSAQTQPDRVETSGSKLRQPATGAAAKVPRFSHVVVIVFENKAFDEVIGASSAPTFNRLARHYAVLANYRGVAHPSLPNYLALASGSTQGITDDCTDCVVDARNLADTLEAAHKTWKTYAEGLPSPGFTGASSGRYAKRHNAFVYFKDVFSNRQRLARIVPLSEFHRDLAARSLPDFSLVVPDQCHDMHDCSVSTGDRWLNGFLPPLLASPQLKRGVVFVVFDEGEGSEEAGGGGHTPALAIGRTVRLGSRSTAPLTHYSLLRTIEDAWRLPRLGRSGSAAPILKIWR